MARPGLTAHRKFRRLARLLKSPILARGALELLWDSCYEAGEDYVGTSEDIETLIGWEGERGLITRALVEAGAPEGYGFIEPVSDTVNGAVAYRVHDLWHHAPDYVAKRRKREQERQQKADPSPVRRTAPNGGHWPPTSDCQIEIGRTPSPSPSPAPSPSHTQKNVSSEASSEPPSAGRGSVESRPSGEGKTPPFLDFPVIGTGSQTWSLSVATVTEWERLYPGVDVRGAMRKAVAWLKANEHRRKTAKGMERFLVSWLNREADRGRRTEHPGVPPSLLEYEAWRCPHDPPCPHRAACAIVSMRTAS